MASLLSARFRQEVSKHKDFRMKNEAEFDVGYPTGFLNFDFMNGAIIHVKSEDKDFKYYSVGVTDGSLVTIIGRSGCGKTTWIMQTAANIIRPFNTSCIFEDSIEGGITQARKETLTKFYGDEMRQRIISRNTGITAENFYERIKMIHDIKINNRTEYEYDTGLYDNVGNRIYKLEPSVYILDSIALIMPDKYADEDELSGQMSVTAGAKAIADIFRRIIPMLKTANIILFVVNHILEDVNINPMQRKKSQLSYLKQGERLPKGATVIYLSNNIIRVDDGSKLKDSEAFGINGSLVDFSLVKSRTNRAGSVTTLVFDQDRGFDPELSLFLMLKEYGRIGGAGAYLYIGDHNEFKFSQKEFKNKLEANEELRKIFMEEVSNILKSIPTESILVEQDYSLNTEIMGMINTNAA